MANIQINIIENGKTTLATQGCICDRNIDINVDVPTVGGGSAEGAPTDSELTISGNCQYKFSNNGWNWFINKYADRIKTSNITNAERMFNNNTGLNEIPFTLNFYDGTMTSLAAAFYGMNFTKTPTINLPNVNKVNFNNLFQNCKKIKDFNGAFLNEEKFINDWRSFKNDGEFGNHYLGGVFNGCSSLRTVPTWFYAFKLNPESNSHIYSSYTIYYRMFYDCYVLDEILNYPVWECKAPLTKSIIDGVVNQCSRLKDFTFETNEDGTPIVAKWKGQTLDFTYSIGWNSSSGNFVNNGMSADKEVKDDSTYQSLKDDPDWWTTKREYSRYNHDSAVRTIQSLPDTSAYLATAGGTNTIKFAGANGSATDGGAISNLTEDEIAVATAKGWTVQIV